MRYFKFIFSVLLVFSFILNVNAQNEESLKELLSVLSLSEKQSVLDYTKQQEADIESEIIEIFKRLSEEKQIAIMEYAAKLELERPANSQPFNPISTPPIHNHDHSPTVNPNQPRTTMSFNHTSYDFGIVKEGERIRHTFTFTNSGTEPLIISNAQGSCGCTVPKWPREPIAPGASSEITVEFNSDKKTGRRDQQVTITANTTPPTTIIRMVGEVTPKGGQ